jgi:hypothetical protein
MDFFSKIFFNWLEVFVFGRIPRLLLALQTQSGNKTDWVLRYAFVPNEIMLLPPAGSCLSLLPLLTSNGK